MTAETVADLCAVTALAGLAVLWPRQEDEPVLGRPVIALIWVALVLAVF